MDDPAPSSRRSKYHARIDLNCALKTSMHTLQGSVALVTGSNRGLGKVFCEHLLQAGATKIYAGARDPSKIQNMGTHVVPVRLDVTKPSDVDAAATQYRDVTLVINNAGILRNSSMLGDGAEASARAELETNFFGMMRMMQRFAPIVGANGGGAFINVLSTSSWITNPFLATYSAAKMAAAALTDSARLELRDHGTRVVGVYAGTFESDMSAHLPGVKTSPHQIVDRALSGLINGLDRVLADDRAVEVDARLRADRGAFDRELQQLWAAAKLQK
jgi:NAD(P)-dependent dehydrogenase (short-subunit alcohol dehydrogenase family)